MILRHNYNLAALQNGIQVIQRCGCVRKYLSISRHMTKYGTQSIDGPTETFSASVVVYKSIFTSSWFGREMCFSRPQRIKTKQIGFTKYLDGNGEVR